ncbi:hypothetical protein TAL182_PD00195 (plasmid) [Rhizobium sp. TAL182]|nr:hypothetical protein TAL182_PD00195 [Rhizobium sp. TAL182]
MRRAEQLVSSIRASYLARTLDAWRGYEREFLIELVRGLDEASFAFTLAPNRDQLIRNDEARHFIMAGAASALRPFLRVLQDVSNGVPWRSTSPEFSAVADRHLINCGRLAVVQRYAAMERHGLAESTFLSEDHLILEVASSNDDDEERRASAWLSYSARQRLSAIEGQLAARKQEMALGIDRYARVQDGWFLRYEPDEDTTAYYRHLAEIYSAGTAEANALPEDTLLGGRTFRSWNALSITAYGRVLHHIACATRLMATRPNLELRNLLTAFAHKEDVKALWQQAGESASSADQVVAGLSLNADTAAICEHNHEQPLPYYIEFGRNFVLLPIFGGMLNASAGLTWHLRAAFRRDWDKAVDGRERVFRKRPANAFSGVERWNL